MFCCCEKDQGGQVAKGAMRPPQKGAGWFPGPGPGSDGMTSTAEPGSVPASQAADFDSDEEDGDIGGMEAEGMNATEDHEQDLGHLQSYYGRAAAERAAEEENQVEETDSDEDEELKEYQEEMNEAQKKLQKICGEEKFRMRRLSRQDDDEDEEVLEWRNFAFERLEVVDNCFEAADAEKPETDMEATTAEKEPPKTPKRATTKPKLTSSKTLQDLAQSGEAADGDKMINAMYEKKVLKYLNECHETDDLQERHSQNELADYHQAVRDRLVKLGGDEAELTGEQTRETFAPAKSRAEAVKKCVKKYNEECEKLGLFKAFSAEDIPEEGLGPEARNEQLQNISTLSVDA